MYMTPNSTKPPEPMHPAVNWQVLEFRDGNWCVQVTCPVCQQARFEAARTVRHRVRKGRFTGYCRADWRGQRGQFAASNRPAPEPPHAAVDWGAKQHQPGGTLVRVVCPMCALARMEPAKAVRYRILRGSFTGRCRLHRHDAPVAHGADEQARLAHAAVDWSAQERRDGGYWVKVTCPKCGETRFDLARSVRYRLRKRTYTGLCRTDAQRSVRDTRDLGAVCLPGPSGLVRVTCPICEEERLVGATQVRRQMRMGTFTGRCGKDRLVGTARGEARPRPTNPWFDWEDREIVNEGPNRRRTMVRVRCPVCAAVRLSHPAALEKALRGGTFRPECALHRKNSAGVGQELGMQPGRLQAAG